MTGPGDYEFTLREYVGIGWLKESRKQNVTFRLQTLTFGPFAYQYWHPAVRKNASKI